MQTNCEFVGDTEGRLGSAVPDNSITEQVLHDGDDGWRLMRRIIRVVFLFCLCALFFMFFY
jgi:hypothetical protein